MKNVVNNPWTVTIVGTTLGVLIAFGLNNWKEGYQEKNRVDVVLEQIKQELTHNRDELQVSYDSSEFIESFHNVLKYIENDTLIMSIVEKANYVNKYKEEAIIFIDSSLYKEDLYIYEFEIEGDINLDIKPPNTGDVSWKLAQNLGVVQSIDFNLLKEIEEVYGVQLVLQKRDEKLLQYLEKPIESLDDLKALFYTLYQNRELQKQLIITYDEVIKDF
jgi:hypothetical protein